MPKLAVYKRDLLESDLPAFKIDMAQFKLEFEVLLALELKVFLGFKDAN